MMPARALVARRAAGLGAALACLAVHNRAWGNGRFPAAGLIALDPGSPDTFLVRATYGLILTKDHGHAWSWICEDAVGFAGFEDPMVSFTADGSLLASTFEGLGISHDTGCDWTFSGGGLAGQYVTDLSVEKGNPAKGVLLVASKAGQDAGSSDAGGSVYVMQLWETGNAGGTWTKAGVNLPREFFGLTVDVAPSDARGVYASGSLGPPDYPAQPGLIERSDDRGASWQPMFIPG